MKPAAATSLGEFRRETVRCAPGIPGLGALGARTPADLAGWKGGVLLEEARARIVAQDTISSTLLVPLPGTPLTPGGAPSGPPRGAGTGHILLRRYFAAPLRGALAARFRAPRSTSFAEREWNLVCALRAAGVGTLEPLAVVALGASRGGFARWSAIAVRASERERPWNELAPTLGGEDLARAGEAIEAMVQAVARGGFVLPRLDARSLLVAMPRPCAQGPSPVAGLTLRAAPTVLVADVRDGRLLGRALPAAELAALRRRVAAVGASSATVHSLPPDQR